METNLINLNAIEHLLNQTQSLKKEEERLRRIKGEDFNIFSILNVEHIETRTHSNFIRELLDPKGSHYKGKTFLKLFLELVIPLTGKFQNDVDSKKFIENFLKNQDLYVATEVGVGLVNYEDKTGGRIDLLIKSGSQYLTIENKIWAVDQPLQLERYYNFQKSNNLVIYLTPFGKKPTDASKGSLTDDDYTTLSYSQDIIIWIEQCIMHTYDQPILRETLKQYLICLKKLTNQMENEHQKELHNLLASRLIEAETITANLDIVKQNLRHTFKNDIKVALQPIADKHNLEIIEEVSKRNLQLRLVSKLAEKPVVDYCMSSFSEISNDDYSGAMSYGLRVRQGDHLISEKIKAKYPSENSTDWWPLFEYIQGDNQQYFKLVDTKNLANLNNHDYRKLQTERIVGDFESFIENTIKYFNEINSRH